MESLRVLTLNTWNQEGPYAAREALIQACVRELDPDLIGFQEVGAAQLTALMDGFPHVTAWVGHGDSGLGVASRWPITRCTQRDLPAPPTANRAATDATVPGGIVQHCVIEAPFGIVPFINATTYFPMLQEGWKREPQMPVLCDVIRELRVTGSFPVLLVGDFNTEPESTEIRFLKGLHSINGRSAYFCDAWARAGDDSGGFTWTRCNPWAAAWGLPDRRIDYIFVGAPGVQGAGAVRNCRVVADKSVDGVFASDHFGVFAELAVVG